MKNNNKIPRIEEIKHIKGYTIVCLWNNNELRTIDFQKLFEEWGIKEGDIDYALTDPKIFSKVRLSDSKTLSWDDIKIDGQSYDIDPITLYNASTITPIFKGMSVDPPLNRRLRYARLAAGLSQEELASRIGTTKQYLSRFENGKSDIQVETLTKIVETGLGKKLKIEFE